MYKLQLHLPRRVKNVCSTQTCHPSGVATFLFIVSWRESMTLKISLKAFDIVDLIKEWPYKFLYRKNNFGLLEIKFKMFLVIWINFNSWIFNSKCLHNSREISASGCWVQHWQFQFLVGANDEYLQFKFSLQFICVWGIFF